jgi:hypothetical protein
MKARMALAFTLLVLALALLPSLAVRPDLGAGVKATPTPQQCAAFCARVRCIGEQVCGLFVNAAGQTVCGCHDR